MFALRFAILGFLAFYSWSMWQEPAVNAFGEAVKGLIFLVGPLLYFMPTFEAVGREHPHRGAIAIVNLFLGWTLLGWVVAAAWAVMHPRPSADSRPCPFCDEDIRAAASKCKHCGSVVEPAL
jgi:hypothetical protein